jgi:hypothetical protein
LLIPPFLDIVLVWPFVPGADFSFGDRGEKSQSKAPQRSFRTKKRRVINQRIRLDPGRLKETLRLLSDGAANPKLIPRADPFQNILQWK